MRRRIEAIPWGEQNSLFSCSLAEWPGVLSADQPGKCRHSSLRANPPEGFVMLSHKAIQVLQVPCCGFLRLPENDIAFAHRYFGKHLSRRIACDRKICSCIPIAFP